jgi:hypothetical protein
VKDSVDHLTELLDFSGHAPYSQVTTHLPDARKVLGALPAGTARAPENSVTGPQSHELRSSLPPRVASF